MTRTALGVGGIGFKPSRRRPGVAVSRWVVAAAAGLPGCGLLFGGSQVRNPPYSWGMVNRSSHELGWQTYADYPDGDGTTTLGFGTLGVGNGGASIMLGKAPIPDVVHVHLFEVGPPPERPPVSGVGQDPFTPPPPPLPPRPSVEHVVDVPVHGHIPDEDHFTGELWLVVTDAGVTLCPETEAEQHRRGSDPLLPREPKR